MAHRVVQNLWDSVGLPGDIVENLQLTGDPSSTLPSSFNLGVTAQASIAASGLAASYLHSLNTGDKIKKVTVDAQHAAVEFASEQVYAINGKPTAGIWDELSGVYPTKGNSFVRIHTVFPHHKAGILSILGLKSGASQRDVEEALLHWDSKKFEDETAARGMCATAFRSFEEWDNHPHAKALKNTLPVQLIKIGDSPKRNPISHPHDARLLQGFRVLDLTRVIAGPVCGRTLAAHGADDLWITSPNLPSLPNLDPDTSRGKRTTQLDLTSDNDRQTFLNLIKEANVFLQGYRPNGLQEKGFGPTELARLRPGIIYASLCAWGWEGPLKDRRGFDSLTQTATGFNHDESLAFSLFKGTTEDNVTPKPFPVQALDHAAGYLLAFGIMSALCKTFTEGGSWEVRVSLAGIGQWIRSLGRLGPEGFKNVKFASSSLLSDGDIHPFFTKLRISSGPRTAQSNVGSDETKEELEEFMIAVKHAAVVEGISDGGLEAPIKLNVDSPVWLPRLERTLVNVKA
ncbi:hypothetical protein M422DRAFT_220871 [Sphaerobolus stellatus SS14]|nr:hypothetical protein M422DRAFT_220871 [Sphaerobolus stellatus SS14]